MGEPVPFFQQVTFFGSGWDNFEVLHMGCQIIGQLNQQNIMDQQSKHYVVEHMEEFLFDWCMHEYMQMLRYLNMKSMLYISNHQVINHYLGKNIAYNQANQSQLTQFIQSEGYQPWLTQLTLGIHQYKHEDKIQLGSKQFPQNRVCLLDLRGEKLLTPEDAGQFDVFVFGGILGDHPPRDRTSALRTQDVQMRNLGSLQFSTDSAVLVTKLIIEKQMKFSAIPFVDEPEMMGSNEDGIQSSVQMEGFRYVTTDYDITTESFKATQSQEPLMPAFIREKLMFDDFDLGELIMEPMM